MHIVRIWGKFTAKDKNLVLWKLDGKGWMVECLACGAEVKYVTKKEALGVLRINVHKRIGYCGTWCYPII